MGRRRGWRWTLMLWTIFLLIIGILWLIWDLTLGSY